MSPGCTYRSGECDENASWQCRAGGEDSSEDSTLDATATVPGASLRARVTTPHHPAAHHCCTTTITGTPMLVDQRRSRSGPAPRHGARFLLRHRARRPRAAGGGGPAGRRVPRRAPPPAAPHGPGRGPVAGRTRRGAAALLDESLAGRRRPARRRTAVDGTGRARPGRRGRPRRGDDAGPGARRGTRPPRHRARRPPGCDRAAERGRPARLGRRLARRRARALPPDPAQRARGTQLRADRRRPVRRRRHHGPGGRADRPEPGDRPPRPDRGAPRAGRDRRGRRRVRRVPGAAAQQRRRPHHPGSRPRSGSRACCRRCPRGPCCAAARPSGFPSPPPACASPATRAGSSRVAPRRAPSATSFSVRPGPARCRRSGVRVRAVHARYFRTRRRARPADRPQPARPAACPTTTRPTATEGDAPGTTGTGESEEFVGRVAGRDLGYAGETGAEARAEAGEVNP